jgi:hypothetical protein
LSGQKRGCAALAPPRLAEVGRRRKSKTRWHFGGRRNLTPRRSAASAATKTGRGPCSGTGVSPVSSCKEVQRCSNTRARRPCHYAAKILRQGRGVDL